MTTCRKKLIEVSIPLEAINVASAREKSIRHGHPSTLHLWWARRPLAACRAVLFAQMVDDPSAWPDRFPTEEAQDIERRRLHKIITDMVPWEATNNERILNAARWEIARSVAWGRGEEPPPIGDSAAILNYLQTMAPPVYDPFSGGGSIPLEAQRLGLRAYGSDLNPVAVLVGKALVEIPPKFAGLPPTNTKSRAEIARGGNWNGRGAAGLAEDVRHYGEWMRDEAKKRIGHLYPKIQLPDGSRARVIAWIWSRTVRSPDPAAKGAMVPLISSFLLSTKAEKKVWIQPVIDAAAPDGYRFEVRTGALEKADEERLKKGTKTGRGSNFACILTGAAIEGKHVKSEGSAGRISQRLLAIVAEGKRTRTYVSPADDHEAIAATARPEWRPEGELADDPRNFWTIQYGLTTFASLFTSRQLVALSTYSDLVTEARSRALTDACAAGLADDSVPLNRGGMGATAYADALATYLSLGVSRLTDAQNSMCQWGPGANQTQHLFRRQAIPMIWDFAESNLFSAAAGDLRTTLHSMCRVLEQQPALGSAFINAIDAAKNSFPIRPVVVSTDPPYYDNIGYADLSDFFYVWLKHSLSGIWPDLFRRLVTPKNEELVASPYRHGGKAEAEAFFMTGMGEALQALHDAATECEPLAIYYAFKQSEAGEDGATSAGWASFLQAVVDAGLAVDGTWPVRTERGARSISIGANALASSIVLVCRKRSISAPIAIRADFVRALKRELPVAIEDIRKAGVGPVDMQQSIIGPGMGIWTRFSKVLEDDDSAMSVKTALSLINRVWEEIENELDAAFDAETQVALAWFSSYGFDVRPSGEMIGLANAKNVSDRALYASGVFKNLHGRTALTPRGELPQNWNPATDKSPTVWECVQHTARVLAAEDGGAAAAGRLVAKMGARAIDARTLAYRLYEISSQKGWSAEALVYNGLAQEWIHLEEFAHDLRASADASGVTQATLL